MSDAPEKNLSADSRLGDLLRAARESRGLDLTDVAGLTNVRKDYLEALEEGRYRDLPEDVYTKNFLRLFAEAVGFDVVRAQEIYRSEKREEHGFDTVEQRLERDRELAVDVPPMERGGRWWDAGGWAPAWTPLVSTVLMVAAVVALALWGFNSTFFNASRDGAEAPPAAGGDITAGEPRSGDAQPASGQAVEEQSNIPRTVRLSVSSDPPGAEVSVDEFPLPGTTPIESAPVTARPSRTIRVTLEGYLPAEDEFDLTFDRNLSFALTPETVAASDPEQASAANESADQEADETAAADGEARAVLTITESTWLEAYSGTSRNQGERLAFMTAQPGQTLSLPLPVYLHVGNAGGVELTVDGQNRGTLGSSGEVRGLVVTR